MRNKIITISRSEYKELLKAKMMLDQIIALEDVLVYEFYRGVFGAIIGREEKKHEAVRDSK